jgi:hypothetical protein
MRLMEMPVLGELPVFVEEDGVMVTDYFLPYNVQLELARRNDSGESFAEIADYIETRIQPNE